MHGTHRALGYASGNAVLNSGPTYGILPGPILPEFFRYPLVCNSWRRNFSACLDEYLSLLDAPVRLQHGCILPIGCWLPDSTGFVHFGAPSMLCVDMQ